MVARVFVAVLVLASLGASALAVGFMGPPTAELKAGQWNIGYSYSYTRQDMDKVTVKESYADTDDVSWTDTYKATPEDATVQRHYAVFGYGINDQWEVFGQVGVADLKSQIKEEGYDTYGVNFDNDFAWGIGTRVTLAQQDSVAWGVSAQINWLDTSVDGRDSYSIEGYTEMWKETTDLEAMELLVAFGPTVDMGGWKLYGGPFYYFVDGDVDYKETGSWDDGGEDTGTWIYKESSDWDGASNFGGFVGAIFDLDTNCKATVEFCGHGDGWGAGTSVMWTF